jgi:GNAT superfamily N-acetyltransferase
MTPEDLDFSYRVYASTRAEEMALTDWDEQEKEVFLRMQFQAQHDYYHQHWPDARYDLILLDEEPVGRLYVHRRTDEIRIVDVALLSEHRNRGIGGKIMQDLLAEGLESRRPVTIHVLKMNVQGQRFYARLGFSVAADVGSHLLMRWAPEEIADGT